MQYDIIVVGAGPAGATAAYYAAKHGAKVLLIDRKVDIGMPVRCAEAVMQLAIEAIELKPEGNWVMNRVNRLQITSPRGRIIRLSTELKLFSGIILDRVMFERTIVARALEEGVDILIDTTVTGISSNGVKVRREAHRGYSRKINCKIIIGADGIESTIGRLAGIVNPLKPSEIGICVQHLLVNIDCDPTCIEGYIGERYVPGGYAWVFPKGRREANVGLGLFGGVPRVKDLNYYIKKFIQMRCPEGQSIRYVVGCVPLTLPPKTTVKGNVILVGDAARMVNCAAGAGIGNALLSGKLAGSVAGRVIAEARPLSELAEYDKIWRARFGARLRRSYWLNRLMYLHGDDRIELVLAILNSIFKLHTIMPSTFTKALCRTLYF